MFMVVTADERADEAMLAGAKAMAEPAIRERNNDKSFMV